MDAQRQMVIAAIRKHMRGMNVHRWPRGESYFIQASYSKWAVIELLVCIQNDDKTPPIIIAEEFVRKMDDYSCVNSKNSLIFSIAKDAAMDVLDLLLGMY